MKRLTPKQTLQSLPIALAQVEAGHTSENVLNEIRQIIYSLYRAKEITKNVYNEFNQGIIQKRNTIFMNSNNSKHLILIDYYSI